MTSISYTLLQLVLHVLLVHLKNLSPTFKNVWNVTKELRFRLLYDMLGVSVFINSQNNTPTSLYKSSLTIYT